MSSPLLTYSQAIETFTKYKRSGLVKKARHLIDNVDNVLTCINIDRGRDPKRFDHISNLLKLKLYREDIEAASTDADIARVVTVAKFLLENQHYLEDDLGSKLPGYLDTVVLYQALHTYVNTTVKINTFEMNPGSSEEVAFITDIAVDNSGSEALTYTVRYNESVCSETAGYMKDLSFDGTAPTANGSIVAVDILKVGCIGFDFSDVSTNVSIELWGPDVTSAHIEVSAVVIRGKTEMPVTTTTTTTSSTASTTVTSTGTSQQTSSTSTDSSSSTTAVTTETSSTNSTVDPTHVETNCYCPCEDSKLNLTEEQLQEKILQIQQNLSVNVSQLSSTIRKLTSAGDSRVSAVSIGYVGVAILVVVFSAVVVIDSAMLWNDIKKLLHNIKTALCSHREYQIN